MPTQVPTQEEFDAFKNSLVPMFKGLTDTINDLIAAVEILKAKVAELENGNTPPESEPVWQDDFTGPAVDLTKWNVRNNTYSSNEESILTNRPVNVALSNGSLSIMAQRETYKTSGGTTRQFTSGYLDTNRKRSFLYGRFEIRCKLPTQKDTSKGMWPAFWLRPEDGGNGEIDIMECLGSSKGGTEFNKVHFAIHHDYLPGADPKHIQHENNGAYLLPDGGVTSDWHTYGIDWRENHILWYVDNKTAWIRTPETTPWFAEVFRKPYNIRMNLQVGGTWAKTPDVDTKFPGEYLVDYVRVYE